MLAFKLCNGYAVFSLTDIQAHISPLSVKLRPIDSDLIPLSQKHPSFIRIRIRRVIQYNLRSQTLNSKKSPTLCLQTPIKTTLKKRDDCHGKKGDLWPHLGNNPHYFGIAFINSEVCSRCGYYADNSSIEKCGLFCSHSYLTTK